MDKVFKERGVFIIIVIFVMNTLNEDLVKWGSKRKHLMVSWDHTSYMQKGSIMSVGLK